jgi:hypothetical protein
MVHALQKIRHYLLGGNFKFFIDHSTMKYLVNKSVLEGRICRWILLFQEFSFEAAMKLGRLNVGSNHLSRLESCELGDIVNDQLPYANIFKVEAILNYLSDITLFSTTGTCPEDYSTTQGRHVVIRETNY